MSKNVMIPMSLLLRVIELLEIWSIPSKDSVINQIYDDVMFALLKKKQSIELQNAYAKINYSDGDDARHASLARYLERKRLLDEPL